MDGINIIFSHIRSPGHTDSHTEETKCDEKMKKNIKNDVDYKPE